MDRAFAHKPGIFYGRYMDDVLILTETKSQFVRAKKRVKKELADLKLKLSPHKTKMGKFNHFHFLGVTFKSSSSDTTTPETCSEKKEHNPVRKSEQVLESTKQTQSAALPATHENRHRTICDLEAQAHDRSHVSMASTRIAANKTQVTMRLHPRSCRRALDKVSVMKEGAVHPAYIQHYLINWAIWWKHASGSTCPVQTNLTDYVVQAKKSQQHDLAWLGRGLIDFRLSRTTNQVHEHL